MGLAGEELISVVNHFPHGIVACASNHGRWLPTLESSDVAKNIRRGLMFLATSDDSLSLMAGGALVSTMVWLPGCYGGGGGGGTCMVTWLLWGGGGTYLLYPFPVDIRLIHWISPSLFKHLFRIIDVWYNFPPFQCRGLTLDVRIWRPMAVDLIHRYSNESERGE